MNIIELLSDKNLKSIEKRKMVVSVLLSEEITISTLPARITGNIAHRFPDKLEIVIPKLLQNLISLRPILIMLNCLSF